MTIGIQGKLEPYFLPRFFNPFLAQPSMAGVFLGGLECTVLASATPLLMSPIWYFCMMTVEKQNILSLCR
jgi:hypothetical protein